MVTVVERAPMDVDPGTSSSGLPVTSENTGLWPVASPLAGCLGKVQERAASLELCPWCSSKDLKYALRSCSLNLNESLKLCTNPPCLFSLVSRPLEDVLASLVPPEATPGNKRRFPDDGELTDSPSKRLHQGDPDVQSGADAVAGPAERCCVVNIEIQVRDVAQGTDDKSFTEHNGVFDSPAAEARGGEPPQVLHNGEEMETDHATCSAPLSCSDLAGHVSSDALLSADQGILPVSEGVDDPRQATGHPEVLDTRCNLTSDLLSLPNQSAGSPETSGASLQLSEQGAGEETPAPCAAQEAADVHLESKDSSPSTTSIGGSEEPVPLPTPLFWQNTHNMCWLDSLLAAVVNCRSLMQRRPPDQPQRSAVWQLMRRYEEISALVRVHQQTGKDVLAAAPDHVLQKADADLHGLRMTVFEQLQPKLRCILGQKETPVFAMPLLLALDSWAEPVFQSTFLWEFKCKRCRAASMERFTKTLVTCTNLLPEWSPLNAVHLAPCNICCCRTKQRRTMILESVPPVFVLHFVEGLPNNDPRMYSFSFERRRYSITTVIQYDLQRQHFVTWIGRSDGSWLELDDLKHPHSHVHQTLPVPAQEMHMVFWEAEQDRGSGSRCSALSTLPDLPEPRPDEAPVCSPDQSLLRSHSDIVSALTASEGGAAVADTSIGSTTLLETFEGLSHDDIVTLTLVEVNADSGTTPADNHAKKQTLDTSPDSSSNLIPDKTGNDQAPSSNSEVESAAELSSDSTPLSTANKVRGRRTTRGQAAGRQNNVMEVPAPEPAANSAVNKTAPDQSNSQLTLTPPPASRSPAAPRRPAAAPPPADLKARIKWVMDKYPLNQAKKVEDKYTPPTFTPVLPAHLKPALPAPAAPNSGGRWAQQQQQQQTQPWSPSRPPAKPLLRTEESDGLPPKAAEMYHGFGIKGPSPLSPPAGHTRKPALSLPPTAPHAYKTQTPAALPVSLLKAKTEVSSSSKKHGSGGSSKVPPGLSETDLLRYRLLKKLKAKKKKLAELNQRLGLLDGANLQPDSTNLPSPRTVSSSTYAGSASDPFSPATTASNLSPDSTDFLSMLANGPDGGGLAECAAASGNAASQTHEYTNETHPENFLDEFFSQAVAERPMDVGSQDLSEFDLFI